MRRSSLTGIVLSAAIALHASAVGAQTQTYDDVALERNVAIPTQDGATLSTDLYRPMKGGRVVTEPLPVLLHRTPYELGTLEEQARYFALHGYVVAVQNVRGRYESGGMFKKYDLLGTSDVYATVAWLAERPYTLPSVGMWGTSYCRARASRGRQGRSSGSDHAPPEHGWTVERLGQRRAARRRL